MSKDKGNGKGKASVTGIFETPSKQPKVPPNKRGRWEDSPTQEDVKKVIEASKKLRRENLEAKKKAEPGRFITYQDTSEWKFGEVTKSKEERYKWKKPGIVGFFKMIPREELILDLKYQREHLSMRKIRLIAANWDWKNFGTLSVMLRKDGNYYVYDGGHRLRAAFNRKKIEEIPCLIFKGEDLPEGMDEVVAEANAWIGTNTLNNSPSAYNKYHAAIAAEDPVAHLAREIVRYYGYEIVERIKKNAPVKGIKGVAALINVAKKGRDHLAQILDLAISMTEAITGKHDYELEAELLTVLSYLEKHTVQSLSDSPWREKLIEIDAWQAKKYMARARADADGQGGTRVKAIKMWDVLNAGKTTRLLKWLDQDMTEEEKLR